MRTARATRSESTCGRSAVPETRAEIRPPPRTIPASGTRAKIESSERSPSTWPRSRLSSSSAPLMRIVPDELRFVELDVADPRSLPERAQQGEPQLEPPRHQQPLASPAEREIRDDQSRRHE